MRCLDRAEIIYLAKYYVLLIIIDTLLRRSSFVIHQLPTTPPTNLHDSYLLYLKSLHQICIFKIIVGI